MMHKRRATVLQYISYARSDLSSERFDQVSGRGPEKQPQRETECYMFERKLYAYEYEIAVVYNILCVRLLILERTESFVCFSISVFIYLCTSDSFSSALSLAIECFCTLLYMFAFLISILMGFFSSSL